MVINGNIGDIKYTVLSDSSYTNPLDLLKNKWNELELNRIYLAKLDVGSVYVALVQKYSSHNWGSAIIMSYTTLAKNPIYAQLINNNWTETSLITNSDLIAHYPKVLFFNIEANSYKIIKEQGTARFSQLVFLQAANTKGHGLYLLSGYGSDGGTTRYNISEIASGSQYNIEIINGTNFKITNSNNSTATVALAMFMGDNPIIE